MRVIASLFLVLWGCSVLADEQLFQFDFEEVADGVWVGVRPDSPRFPVMGNTMFVISDEGVVVFDGGGVPGMADQIIDKVRELTTQPVTHVIISHWHGDHNFGVYRFAEEFANVEIVAHQFTADVIDSPRIAYIDRSATFFERNRANFQSMIDTGKDNEGNEISEGQRQSTARILAAEEQIDREYQAVRVVAPNRLMEDKLTIASGERLIEVLHLGHANTAGDIVMWLPEERIIATGDIVVLPSPYAFNVPPRAWAETLRNIEALDYRLLVPGHGPVQRDSGYVELLVEVAEDIAEQRDALLAEGLDTDAVSAALDFSAYEERFTGGDAYKQFFYYAWFEGPFRAAAMKALTGEPMVTFDSPEAIPFTDERWQITANTAELATHLGQDAIKLQGGMALLGDLEARNAIVEFDIATNGERGFAGLMFRVQDENNYEHFYVRPHQSGKPDANQYTPVYNGVSAWQLYHGPEYATPITYPTDTWMHVKIVYAEDRADVYVDSEQPVLRVNNLKREVGVGGIGVNAANFSPAWFANFTVTKLADSYVLPKQHVAIPAVPSERVLSWRVSETLDSEAVQSMHLSDDIFRTAGPWTDAEADKAGLLNLAAVAMEMPRKNTRIARLSLSVDRAASRILKLGYSDSVRVFVNGELQYAGDNTYQSRDYRYLGTIGLFDSVVLPLRAGENEILIAVTEAFGGWGVMAEFEDLSGIEIRNAR